MNTIPSIPATAPRLRAVIFDLGETLLDPGDQTPVFERDQAERDFQAVYDYLETQAKPLPTWPAFFDHMVNSYTQWRKDNSVRLESIHIGDLLQNALSRFKIALGEAELRQAIALTYRLSDQEAVLYPDALATLDALREQGLQLGLVSNTIWPGWCHETTMARLGLASRLTHRVYSADQPYRKPHPSIFQGALGALGVAAREAVYVGDFLEFDIQGAQSAGMKGILRRVPYRQEQHPRIVPDAAIDHLSDLLTVLDTLYPQGAKE